MHKMAENQSLTYEALGEDQKAKLLNTTLDLLAYKPSLIGDVKSFTDYLDKIEEFAKILYERFPKLERKEGSVQVKLH